MQGEPPNADPDSQALADLRGRIVMLDNEMVRLMAQRRALVEEYERRRYGIIARMRGGPAPAPAAFPTTAPPRQEWSGSRVRALLLWLGAALLAISALTFTAVAWSRLGEGGRALLLLGVTTLATMLAIGVRRRLPMTAQAFAGLSVALVLVDVYALRRAGLGAGMPWQVWWAIGTAAAAGFAAALGTLTGRRTARFAVAALAPIPFELLAGRITGPDWAVSMVYATLAAAAVFGLTRLGNTSAGRGGYFYPEGQAALAVHAVGTWAAAAVLAAVSAAQPTSIPAAIGPALAVGVLAAAPELAVRRLTGGGLRPLLAVLVQGVPAGVALTLAAPLVDGEGALALAVAAGGVTVAASRWLPAARRTAALIAGTAFAIPGALFAAGVCAPAVLGPLNWLSDPWSGALGQIAREALDGPGELGSPPDATPFTESWPAFWSLAVICAAAIALGLRRHLLLGIATAAAGLAGALLPINTGASVLIALAITTSVVVLGLLAGALVDRRRPGQGWPVLPGVLIAAVPATGWAAVSVAGSVITPAVAAAAAAAGALIARSAQARAACGGLAALLGVVFVGLVARAAGASLPAAGFAAVVASGLVLLAGATVLRAWPATGAVFEYLGAATTLAAALFAAGSTPWLAGALTALVPIALAAAVRPDRRVVYGAAAGAAALGAVWAWLAAARVDVVEAYTAPAAALALGAGIALWRSGPGRSWVNLGAALVLGIGPTLLLGIGDDDGPRLIVAAVLAFAAVVAGAVLRLQAPLCIGAVALVAIGIDQWGDEIVRLPRWITLGVVGVLLMWIGATFEHRRRDWRRASDVIGRFG